MSESEHSHEAGGAFECPYCHQGLDVEATLLAAAKWVGAARAAELVFEVVQTEDVEDNDLARLSKTPKEVAKLLKIAPDSVRKRVVRESLYGVRTNLGVLLPSWQFTSRGAIRGLDKVVPMLHRSGLTPPEIHALMHAPCEDLRNQPPREWLMRGGKMEVAIPAIKKLLDEAVTKTACTDDED